MHPEPPSLPILAAFFDLDETLHDRTATLRSFLRSQHRRYGESLGRVPIDRFTDRFLALDARGSVPKPIVYKMLLGEFSLDLEAADCLLADYCEQCALHAVGTSGMSRTLSILRQRGLKLGIITNGETEFQNRHIEVLCLSQMVDTILISAAERLRKPDILLFHRAAERVAVSPGSCLFVGDSPEADILGAHAAGMRTAWYSNGPAWPESLPGRPGPMITRLDELLTLLPSLS